MNAILESSTSFVAQFYIQVRQIYPPVLSSIVKTCKSVWACTMVIVITKEIQATLLICQKSQYFVLRVYGYYVCESPYRIKALT